MSTPAAQGLVACVNPEAHSDDWLATEDGTICTICGCAAEESQSGGPSEPAASSTPAPVADLPARYADFEVRFTDSNPPKLILPDVPASDDQAGLAAWLTVVLGLDRGHQIVGAAHLGPRGAEGHVVLRRAEAADLRFEPAAILSSSRRLLPALIPQLLPSDEEPYGFRDEHARRISFIVQRLCGAKRSADEDNETAGIVGAFMLDAEVIEGHTTYGTGAQRYEAASVLRRANDERSGRPIGRSRYLLDADTGEAVIRVSDLASTARNVIGSSLRRGWLDARMEGLGWPRVRLDGREEDGRAGRHSHHIRIDVYRGHLSDEESDPR